MKIGRMRTEISRGTPRADVSCPVYTLTLQTTCSPIGRPINRVEVLSWEDLLALHRAASDVIARRTDSAVRVADPEGSTTFTEIDPLKK